MFLHLDCRHYLGDRPCKFGRPCEGCDDYQPMGPRVLIVKLGALGDVVRTGSLLPGLKRAFSEPPYVTWLTAPEAVPLVERMPDVDRVLAYDVESLERLRVERFDLLVCLDKDPGPCAVAVSTPAEARRGIGLSRYGTPHPLNQEAEYYFELGLNDEEKFHKNRKSYPRLIYDALGLDYQGDRYELALTEADRRAAEKKFASFGASGIERWLGINPGAGSAFAYKAWREEGYIELVRDLIERRPEIGCVLLGGPEEAELLERIQRGLQGLPVFHAGVDNPLGDFAAIVGRCDVVLTGDTLAMHLAIALRRHVVALFGPTCEQEIDLFGRGTKIKSSIGCSPCYRRSCDLDPTCQDLISEEQVLSAVLEQFEALDRPTSSAGAQVDSPARPVSRLDSAGGKAPG